MKILVAAGGTGGHFYPGLSVAKEVLKHGDSVHFVIRRGDFVSPLLEREQIPFSTIEASGFQRRHFLKNIFLPFKLAKGFFDSFRILRAVKPDALMLMGGYLSVPLGMAGFLRRIPILLHEQNMKPGLANKLLSRLAKGVAVSFEKSRGCFRGPVVTTGNPIRADFFIPIDPGHARQSFGLEPAKRTVLIFGGSLGAHRLNILSAEALGKLAGSLENIQVLHLSGEKDVPILTEMYRDMKVSHRVLGYCHDMPSAYSAADLVIGRAGASTIAELLAVRRPSILVPYPHATDDHQTANAMILVEMGVAECHQEKDLSANRFADILRPYVLSNEGERKKAKFPPGQDTPRPSSEAVYRLLNSLVNTGTIAGVRG